MVVVSLNVAHKTYPVIYSIDDLPYDCTKIIAVPKPVGGLLVVSANGLIHLDQGSSGTGVAVNGYAPLITAYPLKAQHQFDIALEGSEHVFLAPDQILFTLRDGEMYVIELQQEGRSLSGFRIEKAGKSMQTSCKCPLGPGYYFVGSRYSDSMLIKYSTKDQVKVWIGKTGLVSVRFYKWLVKNDQWKQRTDQCMTETIEKEKEGSAASQRHGPGQW